MPFHKSREWCLPERDWAASPADLDELAEKLYEMSWCSCNAWRVGSYVLLNDQTSPDGAFEVAVMLDADPTADELVQVESVTLGWLSAKDVRDFVHELAEGDFLHCLVNGTCKRSHIQTPDDHGRCDLCA